jgi:tRNA (cytidine/uridine-2'-O-)-methyltransferase
VVVKNRILVPAFSVLHVILFQPRIPQNTGNIGRLCAVTGCRLHLIHPLGFRITDAKLKRAGLDYWYSLDVHHHADWDAFLASGAGPSLDRIWLVETGTDRTLWEAQFTDGDGLLFGSETEGTPGWLMARFAPPRHVCLPHANRELRSLNLSTSVGVAVYEAWRQISPVPGRSSGP